MPIVKLNDLFKGLSGTLGGLTLSSQNGRVVSKFRELDVCATAHTSEKNPKATAEYASSKGRK